MLLATKGLLTRTLDDAESFLREFIFETLQDPHGPMQRHSHDYDLYLPWVHEEVMNAPQPPGSTEHASLAFDRMFMDASWSLVQKGYLRPGPRTMSAEVRGGDFGKGFSLMPEGIVWVKDFTKES